ncbi:hypothetical protein PMG11_01994 [Penicillium brasilianum]|uniref:CENP-V/GFA domain-containing protein n=1 Tax=Penicillium brasilianum TaxID=104259 RepID=A0A0F7TL58_PENBI|nr:hypothetical protein PMG11_01994 [Penicillium brasilianum]
MAISQSTKTAGPIDHDTGVTYEGSCHCKAVLYSVKLPSPLSQLPVVSCNCSYCHSSGSLHAFAGDIEIHQGAQSLTEYRFGSHSIKIFFCKTCGANVYNRSVNPKFIYGKCAINVRLLQGVDLEAIEVTKRDGKDFYPPPLEGDSL